MTALQDLLADQCSPPLGPQTDAASIRDPALRALLQQHNGAYAFQNALWILADSSTAELPGHDHPAISGWKDNYPNLGGISHMFAVDSTGYPFVASPAGIHRLDLETGNLVRLADDLEGWARLVLDDFQNQTGWPVAKSWQDVHGPLPPGFRLMPRIPFVGGGKRALII